MTELMNVITGVGFPIGVAVFLLVKIEPAIKENTRVTAALTEIIRKCIKQ